MEYAAIFHDATKKYCYAVDKGRFVIRLKTKRDDIRRVVLHYRDKYIPVQFHDTRQNIAMEKCTSDRWSDYYEAHIHMDVVCLRYFFEIEDMQGDVTYYGNHDFFDEEIDNNDYMYDCPQNLREEECFHTPAWANNKIVYQIFPSRYATSQKVDKKKWYKAPIGARDNLKGDLRGIINHLDHLEELGIDVIYMTPIFESPSSHKYDTVDYYQIDSSFGTKEDLKELVDKAHAKGMKVILDGVFNHTSQDFFAFADIKKNQEKSKYVNWYYIKNFPLKCRWGTKPNFKCFSYFGGMPKLNMSNEETVQYFLNVGQYWIKECDIDGWRLDVSDEIGHAFWKRFRKAIKAVKADALLIGEIWHHAEDFLEGDEWDTVMNYPFYFAAQNLIAFQNINVTHFLANLGFVEGNLNEKVTPILWNMLDSHDTPRFMHKCNEDSNRYRLAVALQLLWPGMPFIYYGDEYGMTGGGDPDCRRGMVWDENYQNKEIYEWYRKLISIRKEQTILTEGKITATITDDAKGLLCIEREKDEQKIVLLAHVKDATEDVAVELKEYIGRKNLITGTTFDGVLRAYEVAVLV